MRAVVDDRAHLQRMLDFEAALARAEAAVAVIPAGSVEAIAQCRQGRALRLRRASGRPRCAPAISPLRWSRRSPPRSPRPTAGPPAYVNWGATAQDIIDTALMLELRAGIDVLLADLNRAIEGFVALAGRHRRTAAVARTLLQHALPMPFGLKLAELRRQHWRARASGCAACVGKRWRCNSAALRAPCCARRAWACGHRSARCAARPAGTGRAMARPQRPAG